MTFGWKKKFLSLHSMDRKTDVKKFQFQLFIANPSVTHGTFYIKNEHTHSMIIHKNTNSIALIFIL